MTSGRTISVLACRFGRPTPDAVVTNIEGGNRHRPRAAWVDTVTGDLADQSTVETEVGSPADHLDVQDAINADASVVADGLVRDDHDLRKPI